MGLASRRNRPVPRIDLLTADARARVVPHALVVLRAALAIALAAAVTALITAQLPRTLDVRTDVVGYPIHSVFNVDRYLWVYAFWVLFFPLAALGLDLALARLTPTRLRANPAPRRPTETTASAESRIPLVAGLRTAFVGVVLGVEVAIAQNVDGGILVPVVFAVVFLYAGVAGAVAWFAAGLRGGKLTFYERLAAVNVLASPLVVLGLFDVSRATEMLILDTRNVHEYPWFPLWLAALLAAALLGLAIWEVRRNSGAALRAVERRWLLLVAAPVLLFLTVARLPGEIGVIDFFHEGEPMAGAGLTADGAVPWRDLMFIHGLLQDVFSSWVGFAVFEDSRWGNYAGLLMLIVPFYWLSQYFLFAYLFRNNVLFLLGTQVAVVLGWNSDVHIRFVLLPFALLLLAALLRNPTWLRAGALAAVLAGQAVVSPETVVAIPAFLAALALFELYSYDRAQPLFANFPRTVRLIVAGLAALLLIAIAFAGLGVLDDFFFYYRTFLSEHTLTGGIPIQWVDSRFSFAVIAPVVLVILAIWFFATAWRLRRAPLLDDWVMGALALTLLLYYPKFLARADVHIGQVFAVAVPLLAYAAYRLLGALEGRRFRLGTVSVSWVSWVTGLAVVLVALHSPAPVVDTAEALPERVSAQAHFDGAEPRLGYLALNAIDPKIFEDVDRVLDAYLGPDDTVLDLSNNPLLFHYMLKHEPATRYYHVSMAIRRHTQADLIDEVERRRPKLAIFSSTVFGLPMWDQVPNQVRHYDVSEYVLDHYRPLLLTHTYLVLARDDAGSRVEPELATRLAEKPVTDGLYFQTLPCDWGYAPNFLSTGPSERDLAEADEVRLRPVEGIAVVTGWAADLEARKPAVEVVAALGRRVFASATPAGERADIAAELEDQGFLPSGFELAIPGSAPLQELRFYALTRSGTARELRYGQDSGLAPASQIPDRIDVRGDTYRVVSGDLYGRAETAAAARATHEFSLPPGRTTADYDWVEIRAPDELAHDALRIGDTRAAASRAVSFRTLDRGKKSVYVHVGACSQWHGYPSAPLYLESAVGQTVAVRLVP